ncbi:glycosyltransferase family 2 protein [Clostridium perfringens]|uniref:glycosyltransferase family 2 protein n=1 Tax=Clostridium perfringens TaxID=1502 RepID=UPI001CCF480C|nr:glycosyltransferase family 2 protein [Clostridium perfringens]EJT6478046.1 glycosyltransferase family 2 protein [Clostridium perfringens]ELC8463455.1 glycosyltransferase family 2 protein [Clostridium perfringens]UBK75592.1 glycosyltransferase family 2 protein [Clostridium perfringens]
MYKISILVPVYNTEKTLRRCLDSLVKQTIKDIEIIITNDGSTDGSQKIIEEYSLIDKRIKYIIQDNKGLGVTRNSGINNAKGEYIAFLDSDDWVDEDYYEKMYEKAKKSQADLVISSYFVELLSLSKSYGNKFNYKENEKEKYINDLLRGDITGFSWNKLYKKSMIENNKLVFPIRGELENVEDQYFSIRSVWYANKIVMMNESNIHYVVNKNSIVQRYQPTLLKDVIKLYKSNKKFFNKYEEDKYIKSMDENLKKLIIYIINNEFKAGNRKSLKDKINAIKKIKEYEEYSNIINLVKLQELRVIDRIYYILLKKDMYITLALLAKIRSWNIQRRVNISGNV